MRNEEDTVPNVNRIEICQLMTLNDFLCKNPRGGERPIIFSATKGYKVQSSMIKDIMIIIT